MTLPASILEPGARTLIVTAPSSLGSPAIRVLLRGHDVRAARLHSSAPASVPVARRLVADAVQAGALWLDDLDDFRRSLLELIAAELAKVPPTALITSCRGCLCGRVTVRCACRADDRTVWRARLVRQARTLGITTVLAADPDLQPAADSLAIRVDTASDNH